MHNLYHVETYLNPYEGLKPRLEVEHTGQLSVETYLNPYEGLKLITLILYEIIPCVETYLNPYEGLKLFLQGFDNIVAITLKPT